MMRMASSPRKKGKRKAANEALSDFVTGESIDFSENPFDSAFGVSGFSDSSGAGGVRQASTVQATPSPGTNGPGTRITNAASASALATSTTPTTSLPPAPAVKQLEAAKIDLRLAMELAAGLEDEATVAARYGYDEGTLALLKAWKPFQVAVSQFQTELESKGHTFKLVAKAATQDVFQEVYVKVKAGLISGELTMGQAMDFLNYATRVAGLEPPKVAAADGSTLQAGGPLFTINITAPSTLKQPVTIDVTQEETVVEMHDAA